MPNADSDSRVIFQKINEFCAQNSSAKAFVSLGQLLYFSCSKLLMELLVILLAAFLKYLVLKKAINIGDRQKGRIRAESVTDCRRSLINC